jgi:hypothetical protein
MGIYENGSIFGIRIYYNLNDEDFNNILFEKKYNKIMNDEEKRNVYIFYTELNSKNKIHFEYYSECSSTYDEDDIFLMWCPMSLNEFLEKFKI